LRNALEPHLQDRVLDFPRASVVLLEDGGGERSISVSGNAELLYLSDGGNEIPAVAAVSLAAPCLRSLPVPRSNVLGHFLV
jgi:hypothetical protein